MLMTYSDAANAIRSAVSMSDVAALYGIQANRAGFAKCPFHTGDKNGSLKIYDGSKGWHCFGCGAGGSVVDFVMQYNSMQFKEAVNYINEQFRLGLQIGHPTLTATERSEAERAALLRQRRLNAIKAMQADYEAWVDRLEDAYALLDRWTRYPADSWQYKYAKAHINEIADMCKYQT